MVSQRCAYFLTPVQAFFVFWYDMGVKMGITDIPNSLQELEEWSEVGDTQLSRGFLLFNYFVY